MHEICLLNYGVLRKRGKATLGMSCDCALLRMFTTFHNELPKSSRRATFKRNPLVNESADDFTNMRPSTPTRKPPPSPVTYASLPTGPLSPPPQLPSGPNSTHSHYSNSNYMPHSPPSSSAHGEHTGLVSTRKKHRRTETTQGVATGSIGSIYGPYSVSLTS